MQATSMMTPPCGGDRALLVLGQAAAAMAGSQVAAASTRLASAVAAPLQKVWARLAAFNDNALQPALRHVREQACLKIAAPPLKSASSLCIVVAPSVAPEWR